MATFAEVGSCFRSGRDALCSDVSQDIFGSLLKANSDSDGKANGFRPSPEWLSRSPESFSKAQRRWTSHRHNEPSKGGSECRPGDCPCGNYGRSYASDTNSNWATSRSGEAARSGSARFTNT